MHRVRVTSNCFLFVSILSKTVVSATSAPGTAAAVRFPCKSHSQMSRSVCHCPFLSNTERPLVLFPVPL